LKAKNSLNNTIASIIICKTQIAAEDLKINIFDGIPKKIVYSIILIAFFHLLSNDASKQVMA
jgi:hypothetical protein